MCLLYGRSGSADLTTHHYVGWHTGDGVAADLLRDCAPGRNSLIHNAVVLTVHALSSAALAALAEIGDGVLRSILGVDLNLVEGVHGCLPVDALIIAAPECRMTQMVCASPTGTRHIDFLPVPVQLSHVVDPHNPNLKRVH